MKEAIKFILKVILIIVSPILFVVLPIVGMLIGCILLMLPGLLIGMLLFDDIPAWYGVIFMAMPSGIGMFGGARIAIDLISELDFFESLDKNIDKGTWEDYMNRII